MINDLTKDLEANEGIIAQRYNALVKQEDNFIIVVQQDDIVNILSVTVEVGTDMTEYVNKYVEPKLLLAGPKFEKGKVNFTIFPRFTLNWQDNEWLEM